MTRWPSTMVGPAGLRHRLVACSLTLMGLVLYWSSAVSAPGVQTPAPGPGIEYVPGEVLVKLNAGTASLQAAARVLSAADLAAVTPVAGLGVLKVKVAPGEEVEKAQSLQKLPGVEYAEPNYVAHAQEIPDDPQLAQQWALTKIDAPAAWDRTHGSAATVVAIVDTGISRGHEDLAPRVLAGHNYVSSAPVPVGDMAAGIESDDNGHGTHIAGIAAASTGNGLGGAGLAGNTSLMPVKVLDYSARGTYENVALGIRWAADHGAGVINLSLGGSADSATLKSAVDYAHAMGCLLVAASGNGGSTYLLYPAAYPNVVSVGATEASDQRAWFSPYTSTLSIVAPGVGIYSTFPHNSYGYESGTSMACSYFSGLAALVWASGPQCSRDEVQQIIQDTAVDLGPAGRDDQYGHGRIDAGAAIQRMLSFAASRSQIAFLADDQQPPTPALVNLNMTAQAPCAQPGSVSWTAVVSPATASWVTVSPAAGVFPASGEATVQIAAATDGLAHGAYQCELLVSAQTGALTATAPVHISLSYVTSLHRQLVFPVFKDYAFN